MNYINKINKRIYQIKLIILLAFTVTGLVRAEAYTVQYIAKVEQLNKPLFMASLELMSVDNKQLNAKRMTVKLSTDKWSQRRFKKWWLERLYLNNEIAVLDDYLVDIKNLFNSIKEPLKKGDVIVIEYKNKQGTVISINGQQVVASNGHEVFTLFVNTWVGGKPPSSELKAVMTGEMVSRPQDVESYAVIEPSEKRRQQVAAWFAPEIRGEEPIAIAVTVESVEISLSGANQTVVAETAVDTMSKITDLADPKELAQQADKEVDDVRLEQRIESPVAKVIMESESPEQFIDQENQRQKSEQLRLKNEYRSMITESIVRHINYPTKGMIAKKMRSKRYSIPEGVVVLGLRVNRLGKLLQSEELVAAETESLNQLAMKALAQASLPKAPSELAGDVIELSLPIRFQAI